jgi:hypothetical protein
MALEGSLRDFDLFSMFNMIKIQGKSGTLVLSRGQEFVKVFFEQGEIVGCDSNQVRMEDRLGTMLVRLGRLSGEELMEMVQLQRQTLKRMGHLLLESGKVSPQDIQDALFNQAMAIIYRTFRWIEGDYRFDSILPPELDREHFPPIPVDTVLMEAARIQDEWPEVQKRLPSLETPMQLSAKGQGIQLDIDQELSRVLEGQAGGTGGSSGLSHEQETVLTYFREPQSINDVLQISRYEELDTCKHIADLYEQGLLEIAAREVPKPVRPWTESAAQQLSAQKAEPTGPWPHLWLMTAVFLLVPFLIGYVPRHRGSINVGLASFEPADVRIVTDKATALQQAWAFRLADPKGGGIDLAKSFGRPIEGNYNPVEDFTKLPDPMVPGALGNGSAPAAAPAPAPASAPATAPAAAAPAPKAQEAGKAKG